MITKEEILQDLAAVEIKLAGLQHQKRQERIQGIATRLKSTADQMQHDQRSAAYVQFKESESYILELIAEVESAGTIAKNALDVSIPIKWLDDSHTQARTFGTFKAGAPVTVNGYSYLVEDFSHSYSGSTVSLLSLSSKMFIDGEKVLPYGGVDCHFNYSTKTVTLPLHTRLSKDSIVVLSGVKYRPLNQVGVAQSFVRYELQEVTP